jgi:hypothetical protein
LEEKMNAIEKTGESLLAEADGAAQVVPGEENTAKPEEKADDALAKYRDEDGELDADAVMAALRQSEERLEGLRKKLADTGEPRLAHRGKAPTLGTTSLPTSAEQSSGTASLAEEMAEDLKGIENQEDRAFAEKFIGLLGKNGLTKEKAGELLSGLNELYQPEDPKAFFQNEMKKLGRDGKEVLNRVRAFRDTMRDFKEFSGEEIAALEQVTQTADGVRLIDRVLEKARTMDSGKFSHTRAGDFSADNFSNSDRIRLYEKAYALRRTNPEESEAEVARLDRMFTK